MAFSQHGDTIDEAGLPLQQCIADWGAWLRTLPPDEHVEQLRIFFRRSVDWNHLATLVVPPLRDQVLWSCRELVDAVAHKLAAEAPGQFPRRAATMAGIDGSGVPFVAWLIAQNHAAGTQRGDTAVAAWRDADPGEREHAVNRLADAMRWRRFGAVRSLVRDRAREQGCSEQTVKRDLLRQSLLLALNQLEHAEGRWRLGKGVGSRCYTGEAKWFPLHVAKTTMDGGVPRSEAWPVALEKRWRWLQAETIKAAVQMLRGESYPLATSGDALDEALDPGGPRRGPDLLALLSAPSVDKRLASCLAALPVADQQLFALLAEGLPIAAAARRLGMKPNAARQRLYRLRHQQQRSA